MSIYICAIYNIFQFYAQNAIGMGRAGLGSQIGTSVNELWQYCRFITTCLADSLGQIMPLVAKATKKGKHISLYLAMLRLCLIDAGRTSDGKGRFLI